ncbi:MAG TPA: prepilin-type N-terminal cleavage/methylation domain-containing protein [Kofleriaceae bacterium]|jgi:prepilin-type N-terminal cleavage/methylation domain-containing protein
MKRRGFTLVELMTVVALVGILAAVAAVYARTTTTAFDTANRVGDLVHEANRRAVALGPVRADVAIALSSKARTEVIATGDSTALTFTLYVLQESPSTATGTWVPVQTYTVDPNVLGDSWSATLGSHTTAPLTTSWPGFSMQCYPDGTCDPRVLFFAAANGGADYEIQAKLEVLPLGGAISTRKDWN